MAKTEAVVDVILRTSVNFQRESIYYITSIVMMLSCGHMYMFIVHLAGTDLEQAEIQEGKKNKPGTHDTCIYLMLYENWPNFI